MAHEVERPMCEVVGTLERFDDRDTVLAREPLVPGSAEERQYHGFHPEAWG